MSRLQTQTPTAALSNADINSVEYGTTFDYGTTGSDGTVTFDVWASPTTNSGFGVQVTPPNGSDLAGSGSQYSGLLNEPTTIPITLPNGSTFSGTFEDSAGNPLAGVQFSIQGQGYSTNFTTGSDGSFSVNVPSGPNYSIWTYGLYASNVTGGGSQDEGEYRYAAELDLTNSIIGDTIQLPPTTPVSFAVSDSNGNPVVGAEVSISDGVNESIADPDTDGALSNADINSVEYGTTFDYGTTGSDGTVTFDVWASPTTNSGFGVQVTPPNGSNLAGSGSQYSGLLNEPTTIPITLPNGSTFSGTFEDSAGNPLAGVQFSIQGQGYSTNFTTGSDGSFSVNVPSGPNYSIWTYGLYASNVTGGGSQDEGEYRYAAELDLTNSIIGDTIQLPPTTPVSFAVSDSNGNPVVGAEVSISDGVNESIADPDTDSALSNADINSVEYGTTFDYGTTRSDSTVTFDVWASPTTNFWVWGSGDPTERQQLGGKWLAIQRTAQ